MSHETQKPIVFFDGYCALCDHFVDFLLRLDKKNQCFFSPLQGKSAEKFLNSDERNELSTVIVLMPDGQKLKKSKAVLSLLKKTGGGASLIAFLLNLVPQFIGDACYDLIAKNRFLLFKKKETCRLPTPEEREKFLD